MYKSNSWSWEEDLNDAIPPLLDLVHFLSNIYKGVSPWEDSLIEFIIELQINN